LHFIGVVIAKLTWENGNFYFKRSKYLGSENLTFMMKKGIETLKNLALNIQQE